MDKLDFRMEGILWRYELIKGTFADMELYSILKNETDTDRCARRVACPEKKRALWL